MFSAIRGRDFIFAVPVKWRMEGVVKNVVKKNQIIITALAIMIVVAGYLNFTGQEISTSLKRMKMSLQMLPQRQKKLQK